MMQTQDDANAHAVPIEEAINFEPEESLQMYQAVVQLDSLQIQPDPAMPLTFKPPTEPLASSGHAEQTNLVTESVQSSVHGQFGYRSYDDSKHDILIMDPSLAE